MINLFKINDLVDVTVYLEVHKFFFFLIYLMLFLTEDDLILCVRYLENTAKMPIKDIHFTSKNCYFLFVLDLLSFFLIPKLFLVTKNKI